MKYNDRLVKCYKLRLCFHLWEEIDETGKVVYTSTCPFAVTHSDREIRPRCNGWDEFGKRCVYAPKLDWLPPDSPGSDGRSPGR